MTPPLLDANKWSKDTVFCDLDKARQHDFLDNNNWGKTFLKRKSSCAQKQINHSPALWVAQNASVCVCVWDEFKPTRRRDGWAPCFQEDPLIILCQVFAVCFPIKKLTFFKATKRKLKSDKIKNSNSRSNSELTIKAELDIELRLKTEKLKLNADLTHDKSPTQHRTQSHTQHKLNTKLRLKLQSNKTSDTANDWDSYQNSVSTQNSDSWEQWNQTQTQTQTEELKSLVPWGLHQGATCTPSLSSLHKAAAVQIEFVAWDIKVLSVVRKSDFVCDGAPAPFTWRGHQASRSPCLGDDSFHHCSSRAC